MEAARVLNVSALDRPGVVASSDCRHTTSAYPLAIVSITEGVCRTDRPLLAKSNSDAADFQAVLVKLFAREPVFVVSDSRAFCARAG